MRAIIMDGVEIGDGCCIGAGAFVREGMKIKENKLVVGSPARVIGEIDGKLREKLIRGTKFYMELPERYFKGLKKI